MVQGLGFIQDLGLEGLGFRVQGLKLTSTLNRVRPW